MAEKMPLKLKREPLIEAVWEIRFASARQSVADLLPGIVFNTLDKYRNIVRLPSADIPAPIVEQDPNLKYVPTIRLEGGNHAVQIGKHVVSLSCRRPYSGWKMFSPNIRELIGMLRNTKLIDQLERFSLRYINLIELDQPPRLSCLNLELKLGSYGIHTRPVQLRTELTENELTYIIHIMSPVEVSLLGEDEKRRGVLLDIDTIRQVKEKGETWTEVETHLDEVHLASKRMFFDLLTPETLVRLGPEYEEQ